MSEYWIADADGRVLGPVGLGVLEDLVQAGRLTGITRVSRDGRTWESLQAVPELQRLCPPGADAADAAARSARQRADAARLLAYLDTLQGRPPHQVLGLPKDASLPAHREAFFKLAKKFHPERLPADADPQLVEACELAFRFYSKAIARAEADAPPPPPPRYEPEQFVGLKPLGPGQAQARIQVTAQNVGMFTDHPMMNLRQGSFFLADQRVLPLGTLVALTLSFEDPPHTIIARGKVAWEDAGRTGGAVGFGIAFQDLAAKDREFLQSYVSAARGRSRR